MLWLPPQLDAHSGGDLLHEPYTRICAYTARAHIHVFFDGEPGGSMLNADLSQHANAVQGQMPLPAVLQARSRTLSEAHPARLERMPQRVLLCRDNRMDVVQKGQCADDFFGGFDGVVGENSLVKSYNGAWHSCQREPTRKHQAVS